MICYIGIDGGGSKTDLRMVDEKGNVLYETKGGGSNPYTVPPAEAEALLKNMIAGALAAMPEGATFGGACMGAAGADTEEDYAFFTRILKEACQSERVLAVNDGYASMYATLKDRPGVVIAAGTGSIAWGKDENGNAYRVGGWGFLFSDEGSGYRMVSDALDVVCRTIDGRAHHGALLLEQLMEAFGVKTHEQLISEIYLSPNPQSIAAYFPLVCKAAQEGDTLALEVINKGMDDLVELAAATARQIGMYPAFNIGMSGSILTKVAFTRELFIQKLTERFPKCTIVEDRADTVAGALYLAKTIS